MCGICGVAGHGEPERLDRMIGALGHRGPDASGRLDRGEASLGHTRLSIIDLSEAGRQPMPNEDESVWLVFNGEIFNFPELRRDLESRHRFRSRTDSEVLVHLWEEAGADLPRRLNGMFAFAILDTRPRGSHDSGRQLFLARDHLGIKPLYYVHRDGRFAFASEIKALLAAGLVRPEIDWQAAWDYFTFGFVPHPRTIWADVRQLPPGSWLRLDLDDGKVTQSVYWEPFAAPTPDDDSLTERLRGLVDDAVGRQTVADVPVGVFLSGGVDSSILTGLMARRSSRPVRTFTIVFRGAEAEVIDEREAARAVASRWGTEHEEVEVDISDPDALLDLIGCFDEPFGNPTFYLNYLVSKAVRRDITVALSGAGGDELFGGYPRYRAMRYARLAGRLRPLGPLGRRALGFVPENAQRPIIRRARLFFEGLDRDLATQYTRWTYYLDETKKASLLRHPGFAGSLPSSRVVAEPLGAGLDALGGDLMNAVQYADLRTFLVDNILAYTDRTSMATSLEVRVPLLDYRLVEMSQRMDYRHKLRRGRSKVILRQAFADLLPASAGGPKKGFCPPLPAWMRTLDHYFDDVMTPTRLDSEGIFDAGQIARLRAEHRSRRRDNSMELFGVMMFDVWFRRYILGQSR